MTVAAACLDDNIDELPESVTQSPERVGKVEDLSWIARKAGTISPPANIFAQIPPHPSPPPHRSNRSAVGPVNLRGNVLEAVLYDLQHVAVATGPDWACWMTRPWKRF